MKASTRQIFESHGGQLRMREALAAGISRTQLYSMRDRRDIELVSRGVYRLANLPALGNPDLVTVALRYPKAVVCLISALSFHEITTQIPYEVSVAVPRNTTLPKLDYPPLDAHWFAGEAYESGIETHVVDDVKVQVYSPEKTLADCFKFQSKLGTEVVVEALRLYKERKKVNVQELLRQARVRRMLKVMMPYMEAIL
jgi:predicted transcriptional regulator of viral defense system